MRSHPLSAELEGKSVAVVGLGKSGLAAASLCLDAGASVVGIDTRAVEQLPEAARALAIELRLGPHTREQFEGVELVVVSPGVPAHPELERLEAEGVSVIGELELASRAITAPILAVGGTNGKSTTTLLVATMLEQSGARVFAGANLGDPACLAVSDAYDWVVFEVSSFQLERAPTFHPAVSVLLNVSEDHLDRYPDYAAYVHAKGNAFVNQTPADVAVVAVQDALCLEQARRGSGRIVCFGRGGDYEVVGRQLVEKESGQHLALDDIDLHGRHNHDNLAAAVAAVRSVGLPFECVRAGARAFRPLPHRMQLVACLDGVRYYDDSKGTNVGAAVTAMSGLLEERCVLIAGGRDKHGSYAPLVDALRERGRALVVLGEAAPRIAAAADGAVPIEQSGSMAEAVRAARRHAQPGDAVLLSPACSSFDMFSGYAERGQAFARAVNSLADPGDS